jgi:hypothetical protein
VRDLIASLHSDASPAAQRLKGYSHDVPLPDLVSLDAIEGAAAAEQDRGRGGGGGGGPRVQRRGSSGENVTRSLPSLSLDASRPNTRQMPQTRTPVDFPTPRSFADGDGTARRAPVDVQVALRSDVYSVC